MHFIAVQDSQKAAMLALVSANPRVWSRSAPNFLQSQYTDETNTWWASNGPLSPAMLQALDDNEGWQTLLGAGLAVQENSELTPIPTILSTHGLTTVSTEE